MAALGARAVCQTPYGLRSHLHTETTQPASQASPRTRAVHLVKVGTVSNGVTTIDVLKLVAVVLMLADHIGLYVFDNEWLRVAGRPVAVIFGFLIGYAATTRVPPVWIALGIGLSLLNRWLFPDENPHSLDILISLALTRASLPLPSIPSSNTALRCPLPPCSASLCASTVDCPARRPRAGRSHWLFYNSGHRRRRVRGPAGRDADVARRLPHWADRGSCRAPL